MPVTTARPIEQRQECQALYLAGVSPTRIASDTGVPYDTVLQWAKRGKWTASRDAAKARCSESVAVVAARDMVSESKAVRERVSGALQANLAVLEKHSPKSLSDVRGAKGQKGHLELTKLAADTGDKVFGWSGESGGNVKLVQVNILAQVNTSALEKE